MVMILAHASRICITLALALVATGARADVMELDDTGARWVADGSGVLIGSVGAEPVSMAAAWGEVDTLLVPDTIMAETRTETFAVPARYADKVGELARRFDLSTHLIEALVWQESRWREHAVSHAGARGLAQLMPGTARDLGVDPDDPMQNLEGGARYLREQLDRFDGDLEKALAAYNAGPGRVIRAGGIPNIRETKAYVSAIMGRLADHSRPVAR
ncbi:MAG: lytic transglycosylase domain-containing protein [Erythrobacter sp.]|nr:lytic transglycosylase domain-containing protein [Erythrobacter sp.]